MAKKKKKKKKKGRPKVLINKKQLEAFMRVKPTKQDVAWFFECHEDTITEFIKKTYGLTFPAFREQKGVKCRHELQRKAITMALRGDRVMLIFCLKNLCGWKDKAEEEEGEAKPIQYNYKL